MGEKACYQTSRPGTDRPYLACLSRWQPTLDETPENTATAPGNLLTIQTSYLQVCLPSLRTSPRPLHEDRRIYRGREYNTGGHSEGGKVVPPGITTSDRGGSSQTRNGPVVLTHQQRRQRRGASLEVTLSVLMSRQPNKCWPRNKGSVMHSSAVRQRRGASLEVTNPMSIASTLMTEQPRFTARDFRPNCINHPLSS